MKRFVITVCLLMLPCLASAETAKDAIRALKKLEAKCQAGISYREYPAAFADAKFEVGLYIEGKEFDPEKDINKTIIAAVSHYEDALSLWHEKYNHESLRDGEYLYPGDGIAKEFLTKHPEMNKTEKQGGALVTIYYGAALGNLERLSADRALNYCLKFANDKVDSAYQLLLSNK